MSRRRMPYWQIMLAVFCLGWVFMYADRTVLSPIMPLIGAEWHLDHSPLGAISSLFFLMYAALQIPTGLLADRYGRKQLLTPGYLLFGLTTALSAPRRGYGVFLFLGAMPGLGRGHLLANPVFALVRGDPPAGPLRVTPQRSLLREHCVRLPPPRSCADPPVASASWPCCP